ncbi:MAG: CPBP family intramembrane metalloprotease [Pirellulales bacterium]|nr:CPBP family intramembrane metalloprotease [Pirellulales bacterium]
MLDDHGKVLQRRGAVLGILVTAIIVVHLPLYLPLFPASGDWLYLGMFLSCGLMCILPFVLAKIAPTAAGFGVQWLPSKWSQWAWFSGLVILMFIGTVLSKLIVDFLPLRYTPPVQMPGFTPDISYTAVVLHGVILMLLFPIAEEIFWRGYLLEQLRKIMHSGVALLIQSFLFALAHLPGTLIAPRAGGYQVVIATFFYGLILGAWRIKFRSILPLIIAHILLNGVVSINTLKNQYDVAELGAKLDVPSDFGARVRSSPKCRQIYLLTEEPVQKAIPAIIDFLGDPDDIVRAYATDLLTDRYRADAEPYLKEASTSGNKKILDGVLFVIDYGNFSGLINEVRMVALTHNDPDIQRKATITLRMLEDAEGLRKIAEEHLNEKIRKSAKAHLRMMEENK